MPMKQRNAVATVDASVPQLWYHLGLRPYASKKNWVVVPLYLCTAAHREYAEWFVTQVCAQYAAMNLGKLSLRASKLDNPSGKLCVTELTARLRELKTELERSSITVDRVVVLTVTNDGRWPSDLAHPSAHQSLFGLAHVLLMDGAVAAAPSANVTASCFELYQLGEQQGEVHRPLVQLAPTSFDADWVITHGSRLSFKPSLYLLHCAFTVLSDAIALCVTDRHGSLLDTSFIGIRQPTALVAVQPGCSPTPPAATNSSNSKSWGGAQQDKACATAALREASQEAGKVLQQIVASLCLPIHVVLCGFGPRSLTAAAHLRHGLSTGPSAPYSTSASTSASISGRNAPATAPSRTAAAPATAAKGVAAGTPAAGAGGAKAGFVVTCTCVHLGRDEGFSLTAAGGVGGLCRDGRLCDDVAQAREERAQLRVDALREMKKRKEELAKADKQAGDAARSGAAGRLTADRRRLASFGSSGGGGGSGSSPAAGSNGSSRTLERYRKAQPARVRQTLLPSRRPMARNGGGGGGGGGGNGHSRQRGTEHGGNGNGSAAIKAPLAPELVHRALRVVPRAFFGLGSYVDTAQSGELQLQVPHGKDEHGKGEHGKDEHGKDEHGKGEHGKGEERWKGQGQQCSPLARALYTHDEKVWYQVSLVWRERASMEAVPHVLTPRDFPLDHDGHDEVLEFVVDQFFRLAHLALPAGQPTTPVHVRRLSAFVPEYWT